MLQLCKVLERVNKEADVLGVCASHITAFLEFLNDSWLGET